MPLAATLISAGVSGGLGLFGAAKGAGASRKAGDIQSQAAQQQAAEFQRALEQYNPQIGQSAERAATDVTGMATQSGANVTGTAGTAAQGVRGATTQANELLQPYIGLGAEQAASMREFMAPGGAGTRQFTGADMAAYDPGYQFRMQEAAKALQSSAAARGGALGGGATKALANYSQNLASAEYGAAFDRFQKQQETRYNRMSDLMKFGGGAAERAGTNLIGGETYAGNIGMRGAEYAGDIGMRGAEWAGGARTRADEVMAQNALGTQRDVSNLITGGAASRAAGEVGAANACLLYTSDAADE